jgi:thioredoxin 1
MGKKLSDINEARFEQDVLQSDRPVLVDFGAEWCGPCRMMTPALEAIAERYDENLRVYKVDVDNNEELAARYGIKGLPTLLVFKNGEERERVVGAVTREVLTNVVNRHI